MTAARATSWKRCSGMAAKRSRLAVGCWNSTITSAPPCWPFSNHSDARITPQALPKRNHMNRIRKFPAVGMAALGLLLGACAPDDPFARTSQALTEHVVLPAYTQWAESDRRLAASAIAYCAGNEDLAAARHAYFEAQRAWAGLQPLLVGPMGEGNRAWQVQFWPDKKNLVGRQIAALLKNNPQLTRADLESGSVVLQGLSAYEYVL